MTLAAGLLLALASTAAINWGWVAQHGSAAALPPLTVRRPVASLLLLVRDLRWLAGFGAGFGGWVLYVAALRLAPLSLVQAVSAGGIAVIAALAGVRGRGERAAVGLGMLGLALLAVSLAGARPASEGGSWAGVAAWVAASVAGAVLAARLVGGGAGLGLAAGFLYGAGDVATKLAVAGGAHLWLAPAVPALHGLAFVCVQLAFQRGSALVTAGSASLLTNALPIAAGVVVFGERLAGGALGGVRLAAFALVVGSAALLARREVSATDRAASSSAAATPRGRRAPGRAPAPSRSPGRACPAPPTSAPPG